MKKIVTTSWDDGHKLDLKLAQLLQKYHLAATFYISPASREFSEKDLLSEQDIRSLSECFEIGGHTLHHPNLAQVPLSFAIDNIRAGKDMLESVTGKKLQSFAYPYGAYTEEVQKAVLNLGFTLARTTKRFSIEASGDYSVLSTTTHVYTHLSDIVQLAKYRTIQWQKLARYFFDQTVEIGGVFHLWGHSWEIDKNNQWSHLEDFFAYISNRQDITYVSNGELV
jgi:peptidoglycan/xylan/chitin deacetylase (PgdA/CDA1 family)